MDNKKELEAAFSALLNERNKSWTNQMQSDPNLKLSTSQMTETFVLTKLAEYELRLRNLEAAQGRADDYLNMNTPLI
jgi:hypothetical protein